MAIINLQTPNVPVDYKELKPRLIRRTGLLGALVALGLLVFARHLLVPYLLGVALSYGYLFTLFFAAETPQRGLNFVFSIFRMVIVSFLIVWIGQFKLLETCVVFCGFLSYKLVLALEYIRYSIGIQPNRGKWK